MNKAQNNNFGLNEYIRKFNELRTIFDNLPEGIAVLIDESRKIIAANDTVSRFFEYKADEIIGVNSKDIFTRELAGLSEIIDETINNRRPVRNFNFEFTMTTGQIRSFLVNTAIIGKSETENEAVVLILNDVSEISRLRQKSENSWGIPELVGNSPAMQEVFTTINTIKDFNTAVLICGETGTGKELVARAIHLSSDRAQRPFVAVQCSALPEHLLESEMFGHERGAFTGAHKDKPGRLVIANGGTLFLDEIGTLSLAAQVKLLRVLQERIVEPLGSNKKIPVDVRLLSATNRDLPELVSRNEFRSDLYYRLKVLQIDLAPLRERVTDIPQLIVHFISRLNLYYGKNIIGISQKAKEKLLAYKWPGNVRELENAVEHAFVLSNGVLLERRHFPVDIRLFETNHTILQPALINPSREEEKIRRALLAAAGNINDAAVSLQMHRTTLWRKMREYGIKKGFGKSEK